MRRVREIISPSFLIVNGGSHAVREADAEAGARGRRRADSPVGKTGRSEKLFLCDHGARHKEAGGGAHALALGTALRLH